VGNYLGVPLLLLAAMLQVSIVPQLPRFLGGEPNLVLLLVLSYVARASIEEGAAWSFLGGIVHDLLTSVPTGSTTLGLLLLVIVIDRLRSQLFNVGFLTVIALGLAGSLLLSMLGIVFTILGGYNVRLFDLIAYQVLPSAAYNVVLIGPVYLLMRRFCPPPALAAQPSR
jgi:rod shape-determining protein MreD